MNSLPKVSVLIPTYNYAHYLDEAIQSVLSQTYTDYELIIVDNHSTDNTDEVVKKYLGDRRITYHKNATNIGMVGNWNKCLEYAKGAYIKFLMADDRFHPLLLEKFVAVMEQYPEVSLVTSYSEKFGAKTIKRELPLSYLQKGQRVIHETLKEGSGNWIGEPTTVMFRRTNAKVGQFDSRYTCLVDWDMWLRQLAVGDCYIIPEVLSYFRTHENQVSQAVSKNYDYTFEEYCFYKTIRTENKCAVDLTQIDIDAIIKKKAAYCAKAMYKVLPKLYNRKAQVIFKNAFKIASAEKVLLMPFINYIRDREKGLSSFF